MVQDFAKMRDIFRDAVINRWDHRFAVSVDDPRLDKLCNVFTDDDLVIMDGPPTAENLARWIGQTMHALLRPTSVVSVRLWETPNCSAEWRP